MKEEELTYQVIGCAMRVHSELGPGLREKPYENALAIDFEEQEIAFSQQPCFPIFYHGRPVGDCRPDFVVQDEVVIECKAVGGIGDSETGQVLNYLRIASMKVGLILNFYGSKLEFKRVVF